MRLNFIIGAASAVFFIAVFSGTLDLLQGFNDAAASFRARMIASYSFVYRIPLAGVLCLLFPKFIAKSCLTVRGITSDGNIGPFFVQLFGYLLIFQTFLVLWVFTSV